MFDRTSPLSLLVEAEMKRDGVMRDLLRMAMKLSMSQEGQDGKDLLAKSLVRVIESGRRSVATRNTLVPGSHARRHEAGPVPAAT